MVTNNYDCSLFFLRQTGRSLEILDFVDKIHICCTRSLKMAHRSSRRSALRPSFVRRPVSTLSFEPFPSKTMSFPRRGHYTGTANSRIGLTTDVHNEVNSVTLLDPRTRLMTPRTLLALLTTSWITIAPWEIVRYWNTEIFDIFHTL